MAEVSFEVIILGIAIGPHNRQRIESRLRRAVLDNRRRARPYPALPGPQETQRPRRTARADAGFGAQRDEAGLHQSRSEARPPATREPRAQAGVSTPERGRFAAGRTRPQSRRISRAARLAAVLHARDAAIDSALGVDNRRKAV